MCLVFCLMVSKKERCPTADRQRGYTFAYDGLSRLTQADYHEDNQRSNHYDTHYAYDLMGNITALQRSGLHDDGAYSLIDDLAFGYEGNRIVKVTDGVMDGPYRKDAWHYRDRVDADIEREYDGNGNLVKDLDAGILRIEYNSLNLPQMIKFSDHSKHVYAYDATGRKLRAEYHTPIMVVTEPQVPDMGEEMPEQEDVLMEEQQQEWNEEEWGEEWEMEEEELIPAEMPDENGEVVEEPLPQEENNCKPTIFFEDDDIACEVTTVDYCGDFIYVNGKLKRMLFPGGYVTFRNDSIECPEYHFYITDHQGNVRIVANQDGTIEQINHYYPYGGLMGESTNSDHQPYKYNGKELDRHHGLDWFDYGARWYNGISWMNPDPLAEKYYSVSPYVYCANNPVKYIDPDGQKVKPAGLAELIMIQNTLPKEIRKFVGLDKNGLIDAQLLGQYKGDDYNILCLKELVNNNMTIEVRLDDKFEYRLGSKYASDEEYKDLPNPNPMSYIAPDPSDPKPDPLKNVNDLTTGEKGFMGKTLFPDDGGIQNSPNRNVIIYINKHLSDAGRAETYSHEANGHGLLYFRTGYNRKAASHNYNKQTDMNEVLKEMIFKSKEETIKNMR